MTREESDGNHRSATGHVAAVLSRLTGRGGDFEISTEDVLGAPRQVMRNDGRSLLQRLADSGRYGDRDYLVTEDRHVSFAEHLAAVRSLAQALRDHYGVGRGDRVAILGASASCSALRTPISDRRWLP